jgi:hypothetical protein
MCSEELAKCFCSQLACHIWVGETEAVAVLAAISAAEFAGKIAAIVSAAELASAIAFRWSLANKLARS